MSKRITRIEYFYPDAPDEIMEADCAIGYEGCDEWNDLLDDGILFYFRDEAEFRCAFAQSDDYRFCDFVVTREVI